MVTIVAYVMVRWDVTISDHQSPEGPIQEGELRGSSYSRAGDLEKIREATASQLHFGVPGPKGLS